jgi:hypothetical protein
LNFNTAFRDINPEKISKSIYQRLVELIPDIIRASNNTTPPKNNPVKSGLRYSNQHSQIYTRKILAIIENKIPETMLPNRKMKILR